MRDAIQKENVEIPGGTLEQGKWEVGLRTLGRIDASGQFNDIIIATVNGVPLRVSDIGYAEDTVQKVATSMFMQDGSPAVQLDIRRASGENTIKVTEAVKARLASVRQTLPPDVTLTMNTDDSRFIYASISSLEEHLLWGSLLASLVVMFFIRNIRAVIISALAIPVSIIATFTLMRAMDFTLNNMTLLALTLAVGIVIDDAIVVLENIFRYVEEKHRTPFDAAIEGTREVALPVMATTLSLVVIFLPVAFMTGYARRFIYPFGWTMAFAILVSMIVSFTLTPMLSSRWLKISDPHGEEDTKHHRLFRALDRGYTASLRWTLAHPVCGAVFFFFFFSSSPAPKPATPRSGRVSRRQAPTIPAIAQTPRQTRLERPTGLHHGRPPSTTTHQHRLTPTVPSNTHPTGGYYTIRAESPGSLYPGATRG